MTLNLPILHLFQRRVRQRVLAEQTLSCHVAREVRTVAAECVFGREQTQVGFFCEVVDEFA